MSLILPAIAFLLGVSLTYRFSCPGSRLYVLDHPNERSLHSRPTPRMGGVAIIAGIFVSAAALTIVQGPPAGFWWVAGATSSVGAISFLDDAFGVRMHYRLAVHALAAAMIVCGGFMPTALELPGEVWPIPPLLMPLISAFFIVWMLNLYNFMDGMDGFAGGMAVIGFGCFAVLGRIAGHQPFWTLNLIVAAGAAGFLVFNFPPAKIFMGDTGSSVLGALAAVFILWAARDRVFPIWVGLMVFSPFVVDATVTLLCRLFRGEKISHAHRTHFYQRLVQLGWGHRRTVLVEYGLMLICSAAAVAAHTTGPQSQWTLLGIVATLLIMGMTVVHRTERLQSGIRTRNRS